MLLCVEEEMSIQSRFTGGRDFMPLFATEAGRKESSRRQANILCLPYANGCILKHLRSTFLNGSVQVLFLSLSCSCWMASPSIPNTLSLVFIAGPFEYSCLLTSHQSPLQAPLILYCKICRHFVFRWKVRNSSDIHLPLQSGIWIHLTLTIIQPVPVHWVKEWQ